MTSRVQVFECVFCRRTIKVLYHHTGPLPDGRTCRCGRPMGLLLFDEPESPDALPMERSTKVAQA